MQDGTSIIAQQPAQADPIVPIALPTVLLITDYRLLNRHGIPYTWNFTAIEDRFARTLSAEGSENLCLYLAFPDATMRDVDFPGLLGFLNTFSDRYSFSVELFVYNVDVAYPGDVPRYYPQAIVPTRINSNKSSNRRLTVRLVTKEVFDFHNHVWRSVLSTLGISITRRPDKANAYAGCVELLQSGFRHKGTPSHVHMLTKNEMGPYFHAFPAGGSDNAS